MDDDVQYLGTKFAAVESLDDPCEVHPSLAGITLHVLKCGDNPAHDLTFHSACSSYVNIGRKSGSDDKSMRRENDDHNAVFTCQVVSARHAKLVFSDGGQVYIVDLHSRHGTHLLRRGEMTLRTLQPEVEILLADGDMLTFGKAVGAGSYHVPPVIVRVELLSGSSSSEPCGVRPLTPFDPPSPAISRPRKLSSGRYGLTPQAISYVESSDSPHSSSSIAMSSDGASSQSEQESDAEDELTCLPPMLRDTQGKTSIKIPAFRSFIREIYHNTVPHTPVISNMTDEPLGDVPSSPTSTDIVRQLSPPVVINEPSRSHSPMEEAASPRSPLSEAPQAEPAVIGAWPASRTESPRRSSLEGGTTRSEVLPAPELDHEPEPVVPQPIAPLSNDVFIELMHRLPPPPPFFPIGGPFSNSIASDFGLPSVPHPPPPPPPLSPPPTCRVLSFHPLLKAVTECVHSEVKGTFKNLEHRITALQETVNDLKLRQTATEDDVVDLQSRIETLELDSERLLCRITGAERNIATLSTLQGQMTALQKQVTTFQGKLNGPEPKPVEGSGDDIKACASVLNNLVSEFRSLREEVERRLAAKVEANRMVETSNTSDHVIGQIDADVQYVRSSKRKRSDEKEEEEASDAAATLDAVAEPVTGVSTDEIQACDPSGSQVLIHRAPVSIATIPISRAGEITPTRPRKRARTAMIKVMHTAAAMAIGAAATWSALAFS